MPQAGITAPHDYTSPGNSHSRLCQISEVDSWQHELKPRWNFFENTVIYTFTWRSSTYLLCWCVFNCFVYKSLTDCLLHIIKRKKKCYLRFKCYLRLKKFAFLFPFGSFYIISNNTISHMFRLKIGIGGWKSKQTKNNGCITNTYRSHCCCFATCPCYPDHI